MLFHMGDTDPILLPQPMTYMRALAHMRSWLKRNATSEPEGHAPPVASMTTHSGKATLLTWANQLELPVELRAAQGHHKHEAPKGMVNLYGRDDTVGGLKTQRLISNAVRAGHHFHVPVGRGAAEPLPPLHRVVAPPMTESEGERPAKAVASKQEAPSGDCESSSSDSSSEAGAGGSADIT